MLPGALRKPTRQGILATTDSTYEWRRKGEQVTVNKESGGGNKSGSGRGKRDSHESARKGGHKGGSNQSSAERSAAAKKGWETRRKRGNG